ncbi:MAG: hypothetical protein JXA94_05110 [Parachlamydiales bacterium]|nr:hypothetical protein [Parachlamydiales bacterium]
MSGEGVRWGSGRTASDAHPTVFRSDEEGREARIGRQTRAESLWGDSDSEDERRDVASTAIRRQSRAMAETAWGDSDSEDEGRGVAIRRAIARPIGQWGDSDSEDEGTGGALQVVSRQDQRRLPQATQLSTAAHGQRFARRRDRAPVVAAPAIVTTATRMVPLSIGSGGFRFDRAEDAFTGYAFPSKQFPQDGIKQGILITDEGKLVRRRMGKNDAGNWDFEEDDKQDLHSLGKEPKSTLLLFDDMQRLTEKADRAQKTIESVQEKHTHPLFNSSVFDGTNFRFIKNINEAIEAIETGKSFGFMPIEVYRAIPRELEAIEARLINFAKEIATYDIYYGRLNSTEAHKLFQNYYQAFDRLTKRYEKLIELQVWNRTDNIKKGAMDLVGQAFTYLPRFSAGYGMLGFMPGSGAATIFGAGLACAKGVWENGVNTAIPKVKHFGSSFFKAINSGSLKIIVENQEVRKAAYYAAIAAAGFTASKAVEYVVPFVGGTLAKALLHNAWFNLPIIASTFNIGPSRTFKSTLEAVDQPLVQAATTTPAEREYNRHKFITLRELYSDLEELQAYVEEGYDEEDAGEVASLKASITENWNNKFLQEFSRDEITRGDITGKHFLNHNDPRLDDSDFLATMLHKGDERTHSSLLWAKLIRAQAKLRSDPISGPMDARGRRRAGQMQIGRTRKYATTKFWAELSQEDKEAKYKERFGYLNSWLGMARRSLPQGNKDLFNQFFDSIHSEVKGYPDEAKRKEAVIRLTGNDLGSLNGIDRLAQDIGVDSEKLKDAIYLDFSTRYPFGK